MNFINHPRSKTAWFRCMGKDKLTWSVLVPKITQRIPDDDNNAKKKNIVRLRNCINKMCVNYSLSIPLGCIELNFINHPRSKTAWFRRTGKDQMNMAPKRTQKKYILNNNKKKNPQKKLLLVLVTVLIKCVSTIHFLYL